jgi:Holliday junction DNA helicase RuvA
MGMGVELIAQLTGLVSRTEAGSVILDVGGVGYQVFVPAGVLAGLPEAGGKATLMTHLIVREDELTLYGFATQVEMQAFRILLGVSGVGPKVALALLSTLEVSDLAKALSTSDTRIITKVPGVGPKLAQRLCLELGDKMAAFAFEKRTERAAAGERTAQENAAYEDAIEGLVSLGYGRPDARRAVERVIAEAEDRANVGALINGALRLLTGGKR